MSGAVTGSVFKYTATGTIPESGCSVQVSGELTLDTAGTRLSGPQTHRTCEGVAVGSLSATRR